MRTRSASSNPLSSSSPISKCQNSTSSIASSSPRSSSKLKQSLLVFGLNDRKTCHQCGMSYLKNVKSDLKLHSKYHQRSLKGREWNAKWGEKAVIYNDSEYIVRINPSKPAEVNAALDLLEIVNKDLNAPDDNEFWNSETPNGIVYAYIKDSFAIGIVSVEKVNQGYWFSVEHGKIVNSKSLELVAGISRIYVCQDSRRKGIGLKLLHALRTNFIYGLVIPKSQIGWSQPSFSGGKLAVAFNGIKHKSGTTLVPVYV